MGKPRAARDEYGFRNVSTFDGKILHKADGTPDGKPGGYYLYCNCNQSLIYAEKNFTEKVLFGFTFCFIILEFSEGID